MGNPSDSEQLLLQMPGVGLPKEHCTKLMEGRRENASAMYFVIKVREMGEGTASEWHSWQMNRIPNPVTVKIAYVNHDPQGLRTSKNFLAKARFLEQIRFLEQAGISWNRHNSPLQSSAWWTLLLQIQGWGLPKEHCGIRNESAMYFFTREMNVGVIAYR